MTTSERIKKYRKAAGMTQKYLAEVSGTSERAIQQYEGGKRQPRLSQIRKLATALGCSISDLVDDWEGFSPKEITEDWEAGIDKERKAQADAAKAAANALSEITQAGLEGAEEHRENLLLYNYRQLNQKGQYEAVKRVQDLTYNPDYTKSTPTPSSVLVAAHNDHADDPEEQEKIQRDLDMLKKIDGQEK